jgi:zinc-ribbon domain
MFCGNCGKQVPEGSGFCPACGAAAGGGAAQPAAGGAAAAPTAAAAQRAKIEAQLKAGSQDAVQAFMILLKDPVGGIAKSYALFDQSRALIVGGIFAVVFALATMLSVLNGGGMISMGMLGGGGGAGMAAASAEAQVARAAAEYAREMGVPGGVPGAPSEFSIMMKALFGGLVFAAVLIGACFLARIIFKGTSQLAGEVYTAGASLLPLAVAVLLSLLLFAMGLYGVIPLVGIFGLAWTILMLNSGCQKIIGISDSKSSLAVPLILVIAALAMGLLSRSF